MSSDKNSNSNLKKEQTRNYGGNTHLLVRIELWIRNNLYGGIGKLGSKQKQRYSDKKTHSKQFLNILVIMENVEKTVF